MSLSMSKSQSPAPASPFAALRVGYGAVAAFVRATWKARRNRRSVGWLLGLDDHMLRDMGLTHGDVVAALSSSPLDDPSARLRVLAVERRAGHRAQARERLAALHDGGKRGRRNTPSA